MGEKIKEEEKHGHLGYNRKLRHPNMDMLSCHLCDLACV
jgi:hypothetical protein